MEWGFCSTSEIKETQSIIKQLRIKSPEGPTIQHSWEGSELDAGHVVNKAPPIPVYAHNQETQQVPTEEVSLEVLLSNGQKVLVTVLTSDQTEDVLEVRCLFCTAPPPPAPQVPRLGVTGTIQHDELYFLPYP